MLTEPPQYWDAFPYILLITCRVYTASEAHMVIEIVHTLAVNLPNGNKNHLITLKTRGKNVSQY